MWPLSYEFMGVLALGAMWVNAVLIALDTGGRWAALGRLFREMRRAAKSGHLFKAQVVVGHGDGGVFARREVKQIGRAMTVPGPRRILFTDKATRIEIMGGEVEVPGRGRLVVKPEEGATLWCELKPQWGDANAFEAAWPQASTFRGYDTKVERWVRAGEEVWVWLVGPPSKGIARARLVSTTDPFPVLRRARLPLIGAALASIGGAAVVTILALWPPLFGPVSTLGGALGLAFFLGIQPVGAFARDAGRLPDQQPVGGVWQQSVG
ncbi:MAG: hypothetical protein N2515_02475 [Deltaproteobacteria bacterium]|nr:hypothetical protein [Deltaproteobacteria bacterium]